MTAPRVASGRASDARSRLFTFLDRRAGRLESRSHAAAGRIAAPTARLLAAYRSALSRDEWRAAIVSEIRPHPILAYLHEDPFSSHGFRKPRGYEGDAVLLDFVYGGGASSVWVENATPLGAALYRECVRHPSFAALRARRDYLGVELAASCAAARRPEILSVACGHLREATVLHGKRSDALPGRLVALDQDPETLATAQADHASLPLDARQISVLALLRGDQQLGQFDFIYLAGLYDYLSDDTARRLTRQLTDMLKPGGRLLTANMLPDLPAAAYMEAVMDWWLIYRTLAEFETLSLDLGPGYRVASHTGPYVGYVNIEKERAR